MYKLQSTMYTINANCSDSGDGIFVKFDFLCPNGTVFNQAEFVCDW